MAVLESSTEWSNELIFDFLNLYKNEPSLWNSATPEHKNRNNAYNAWSRIRSKLKDGNISMKDLKKKREHLMTTYRRLRTKIKESMKTCSSAEEIYKPVWPFYSFMATFLDDIYNPRKTKNSENPDAVHIIEVEYNAEDEKITETSDEAKVLNFKSPKSIQNTSKKAKLDEAEKRMDEPYNYLKHIRENPDQDECLLYTDLLCKKLRALKENTRETAMLEIDRYIYNLKQQDSQQPSNYHHAPMIGGLQPAARYPFHDNLEPLSHLQQFGFSQSSSHLQPSLSSQQTSHAQPSPNYQKSPYLQPSPSSEQISHSQPSPDYQYSPTSQASPSSQQTSHSQPSPGYKHPTNPEMLPASGQSSDDQQTSKLKKFRSDIF